MRAAVAVVCLLVALGGCRGGGPRDLRLGNEPYLLVWAGDDDRRDADFLAVLDANPRSRRYDRVLATMGFTFFRSAVPRAKLLEQIVYPLKDAAHRVEQSIIGRRRPRRLESRRSRACRNRLRLVGAAVRG